MQHFQTGEEGPRYTVISHITIEQYSILLHYSAFLTQAQRILTLKKSIFILLMSSCRDNEVTDLHRRPSWINKSLCVMFLNWHLFWTEKGFYTIS